MEVVEEGGRTGIFCWKEIHRESVLLLQGINCTWWVQFSGLTMFGHDGCFFKMDLIGVAEVHGVPLPTLGKLGSECLLFKPTLLRSSILSKLSFFCAFSYSCWSKDMSRLNWNFVKLGQENKNKGILFKMRHLYLEGFREADARRFPYRMPMFFGHFHRRWPIFSSGQLGSFWWNAGVRPNAAFAKRAAATCNIQEERVQLDKWQEKQYREALCPKLLKVWPDS